MALGRIPAVDRFGVEGARAPFYYRFPTASGLPEGLEQLDQLRKWIRSIEARGQQENNTGRWARP